MPLPGKCVIPAAEREGMFHHDLCTFITGPISFITIQKYNYGLLQQLSRGSQRDQSLHKARAAYESAHMGVWIGVPYK